ncbi:MAG: phosphatase PAP2-related protein [Ignavibacteriaceae bacterium]
MERNKNSESNKSLIVIWKENFKTKNFKAEFFFTIISLVVLLFLFTRFLIFVEGRNGVAFNDPFLSLFNPIDTNLLTFGLIYISIFTGIFSLLKTPPNLVLALQAYVLMLIFRTLAMYSLPLDSPPTMIPLVDPIVKYLGTGIMPNKDFFFSGHTATLFLLFLVSEKKIFKVIFLICTIIVGFSVILQHTHYTVDVLAAPFFSYGAYRIVTVLKSKFKSNQTLTN